MPNGINLQLGNLKPLKTELNELTKALRQLDSNIQNVATSTSLLKQLFGNNEDINAFVASMNKLKLVSSQSLANVGKGLDGLTLAMKRMEQLKLPPGAAVAKIADVISKSFDKLRLIQPLDRRLTASINSLQYIISTVLRTNSFISSGEFDKGGLDESFGVMVNLIVKTFDELAKASRNIESTVGTDSFRVLSSKTNQLIAFIPKLAELGAALPKIPTGLFSGLRIRFSRDEGIKNLKRLFEFFKFLSQSLAGISSSIAEESNLRVLDTLSSAILRLSKAIPAINAAAAALPRGTGFFGVDRILAIFGKGRFGQLKQFFDFFKFMAKAAAGIARSIGSKVDLSFLDKLATPLVQLSKALPRILEATKTLPKGGFLGIGKFKGIREFFSFIKAFSKELAKVPQVVTNVPQVFNELSTLATNLKSSAFKNANLDGFENFTKKLAKGLEQFNNVRVDPERLKAVAAASASIREFSVNSGGIGNNFVRGLAFGAGYVAAQAIGKLILSLKDMKAAALDAFQTLGTQLRQIGPQIKQFGQTIVRDFGFDKLLKSSGLNIAAEFEDLSNQLSVFAKDIPLQAAQDFADTIGIKYPLSANQALKAILDLSKAGRNFPQIQEILPNAADLAALSGGDLELATRSLIAAASGFERFTDTTLGGFENIKVATNTLAAAADISTASVSELSEGIANSASAANQAGLTYEQLNAALAILNDRQIRGADAGTALRSAINSLQRPEARKELTRLGVALFNADGSARDFNLVIKDINASFKSNNFTQRDITLSLQKLSDTYGRSALSALLASDGFDATIAAMREVAPATDRAQLLMGSFRGVLEQLRGSLETLYKNAFVPLIERALKPAAQALLALVNTLLLIPQPILNTIVTMVAFGAALATIAGSALIIVGVLTTVTGAMVGLLATATRLLINLPQLAAVLGSFGGTLAAIVPIAAIIAGGMAAFGAAVETAFFAVQNNIAGAGDAFNEFRNTLSEFFDTAKTLLGQIGRAFSVVFGDLFSNDLIDRASTLTRFFNRMAEGIAGLTTRIKEFKDEDLAAVFAGLYSPISAIINSVRDISGGVFNILFGDSNQGIEQVRGGLSSILREITLFIDKVTGFNLVKSIFAFQQGDILTGIQEFVGGVIRGIAEFVQNNAEELAAIGGKLFNFFFNPLNLATTLSKIFGLDQLTAILEPIAQAVTTVFEKVFGTIFKLLRGDALPDVLEDALGGTGRVLGEQLQNILDTVNNVFGTINDSLIQPFLFLLRLPSTLTGINGFFKDLFDLASSFFNTVNQVIGIVSDAVVRFGTQVEPILKTFAETLGSVINFILSIPSLVLDFTRGGEIFRTFFHDFVQSLRRLPSILGQLLQTVVDTVSEFLRAFIPDFLNRLSRAFTDILVNIAPAIGQAVLGLISTIAEGIVRGLDISGSILQVAAAIVKGLSSALLNLLPNLFSSIAATIQNEAVASVINFIADALRRVVDAFTSFLAFPLELLGSFIKGVSALFDIIERLGGSKVIAVLAGLIFYFSGLADSIQRLVVLKVETFFQKIALEVNNLIFKIQAFGQQVFDTVVTKVGQVNTFINTTLVKGFQSVGLAFRTSITAMVGGVNQLRQASAGQIFSAMGNGLRTVATVPFNVITGGIRLMTASIRGISAALAPLIGPIALLTALKAAFDGFAVAVKSGNLGEGILEFFRSFGEQVLNFLGLSDKVADFERNLTLIGQIVEAALRKIGLFIQSILTDIRARIEQALADLKITGESDFAKAYFGSKAVFENAGSTAADEFFKGLAKSAGDNREVVEQIAATNANTLLSKFKELTEKEGGLQGQIFSGVDLNAVADALFASGKIKDAFAVIKDRLNLNVLFANLRPEEAGEAIGDYLRRSFEIGVDDISAKDKVLLQERITRAVGGAKITQAEGKSFLIQLGLDSVEAERQLGLAEIAVRNLTLSISELYGQTRQQALDDLTKQFNEGTISADEYNAKITELGDGIEQSIDKIRDDKIADLKRQLDDGVISQKAFAEGFESISAEADTLKAVAIGEEIDRIAKAAGRTIPIEKAAEQINVLKDRLNELKSIPAPVADELNKLYNDLASGVIKGDEFATRYAEVLAKIKAANEEAKPSFEGLSPDSGVQTTPLVPIVDNGELEQQAQDTADKVADIKEDIQNKIEEFNIDAARDLEDSLREEQEALDEIREIQDEYRIEEGEKIAEHNLETQRLAEDHQEKMLEIERDTGEQLEDAIGSRDAAAAQRAIREGTKKKAEEEKTFALSQKRREEDFQLQLAEDVRKRDQRILNAQQEYNDLVAKNARERQRKLEDHNRDLAELNGKLNTEVQMQGAANNAQLGMQQNFFQALIANAQNGLNAIRSTFGNFFQSVLAMAGGNPAQMVVSGISNVVGSISNAVNTAQTGGGLLGNILSAFKPKALARGGNVSAGTPYQVGDPNSELFRTGGKTYLLPGSNGRVQPPRPGYPQMGQTNLTISLGGINIQGGASVGPDELMGRIEQRIIPKITQAVKALQS